MRATIGYGILLFGVAYLLLQFFYPAMGASVGVRGGVDTLIQQGVSSVASLPQVASLLEPIKEWLGVKKGYVPNKYGYGGINPSGGLRKGGNGRGIPDEVSVGWWNGTISYPDKHLSPVVDSESIPEPVVTEVGWWGE
jgi:hypothetical protein